ncbi:uncharacterized protein GGS25DRAFT_478935 [Hypoxylon fragiforme]|uniref:uncharacterized protein n=1 Tax=Hypoxylon fragiforme TaxID=63214 RepID=UPI0020C631CF|nr:uncharacterized protein GGS25DRAFT_478935 [Hypoxylon fragiforme]KAI2613200.1 hypothetical protein GGS25DRAFT_478935 [Hypoxylon fragiforme]
MDWPTEDVVWTNNDLRAFNFAERPTTVLQKLESDTTVTKNELLNEQDWEDWFTNAPNENSGATELGVVLCTRAPPIFDDNAPVSHVSVTRDTWEKIVKSFHVHRSVIRSIARHVSCFSSIYRDEGTSTKSKIYFTARMSKLLPGDLALSVTYIPGTSSTFAVIYGCNEHQKQEVEKRIRLAEDKTKYPLLIIGIFAELERERLVENAEGLVDGFALTSNRFENEAWDASVHMSNEKTQGYLRLCAQSRNITDQIRAVKRQTLKLMGEIDEFNDYFASHKGEAYSGGADNSSKKARHFRKAGAQMKKRLQDIINEYDDKVDECNMIVGNTTLAMQTVWNQIARHDSELNTRIAQTNTVVSLEAKKEGTQMKLIALLTMVYLPFSSVAAIFSMDLFDWDPPEGKPVVSKFFWVFAVVAVGLTAITFFAWYQITSRHELKASQKAAKLHNTIV